MKAPRSIHCTILNHLCLLFSILAWVCGPASGSGRNVALQSEGGTATASSTASYLGHTNWPRDAIDGDPSDGWAGSSIPAWLKVEFDRVYRIEEVGVAWSQHNHAFSISLSLDGSSWTTVVPSRKSATNAYPEGMAWDDGSYVGSDPAHESFSITPTDAKYIRIDIATTSAPGSHIFQARVNELEAYTLPHVPKVTTLGPAVTTASITLRARLDDDGGVPCEYRFGCYAKKFGLLSAAYTPWQCCARTGEELGFDVDLPTNVPGLSSILLPGVEIGCVAEARNSGGASAGGSTYFMPPLQNGLHLHGKARDGRSSAPLANVNVSALGQNASTNSQGEYSLSVINTAQPFALSASKPGYTSYTTQLSPSTGSVSLVHDFKMFLATAKPVVTEVTGKYDGIFLAGIPLLNECTARIQWNGTPGTVEFYADDTQKGSVAGTSTGAKIVFNMGKDFPGAFGLCANKVRVRARNAEGGVSAWFEKCVIVLPLPEAVMELVLQRYESSRKVVALSDEPLKKVLE